MLTRTQSSQESSINEAMSVFLMPFLKLLSVGADLLTRSIYLVVVRVSTQLRSNVFIKTDHFDKHSTTLGLVMTPGGIRV